MTVRAFVDSNVLIYAASQDASEKQKKAKAVDLISQTEFGLSGQVLAEFYSAVTRKVQVPLPSSEALEWVERLEQQPCVPVDASTVKRGAALSERFQISYWDGAIIAAAESLGATTLYSEDMSHGQIYGTVQVVNPFK